MNITNTQKEAIRRRRAIQYQNQPLVKTGPGGDYVKEYNPPTSTAPGVRVGLVAVTAIVFLALVLGLAWLDYVIEMESRTYDAK